MPRKSIPGARLELARGWPSGDFESGVAGRTEAVTGSADAPTMHGDAPTRNEVATKTATSAAAAYHRAWRHTEAGRAKFVAAVRRYRERNPDKNRAHRAVDNALRCPRDGYALIRGSCPLCDGKQPADREPKPQPRKSGKAA